LDNRIWVKHVEEGDEFANRIHSLRDAAAIGLHVDGEPILFRKMRTGRVGRTVAGLRPDDSFKDRWSVFYSKRRGARVSIEPGSQALGDPYLASINSLLSEWDSPADNAAYNDL
jgi:hypothetical protein